MCSLKGRVERKRKEKRKEADYEGDAIYAKICIVKI